LEAKLDLNIDKYGFARFEKTGFDVYNKLSVPMNAVI